MVLPVQSPGREGDFSIEVTPHAGAAGFELRAAPAVARLLVARFECADSDADPKVAWRAKPVGRPEGVVGQMEVYHLPFEAVRDEIVSHGGIVHHYDEDDWAGPHYVSCHLTVIKRQDSEGA